MPPPQGLPDSADKAEATRNVMQQLPPQNLAILKALFTFLREVAAKADVNRMTASNLAIVLGPNLLWSRDATANIEGEGLCSLVTRAFLLRGSASRPAHHPASPFPPQPWDTSTSFHNISSITTRPAFQNEPRKYRSLCQLYT